MADEIRSVIADRVQTIRKARKLTQEGLAQKVSEVRDTPVGQTWVSRIEGSQNRIEGSQKKSREPRAITIEDLVALAFALRVPIPVLVTPESGLTAMTVGKRVMVAEKWRRFLRGASESTVMAETQFSTTLRALADAYDDAVRGDRDAICLSVIDAATLAMRTEDRLQQVLRWRADHPDRPNVPATIQSDDGDLSRWFEEFEEQDEEGI